MKYGLIHEQPVKKDYVFGGKVRLAAETLQADGQWDAFLPVAEVQNLNGVEPFACVSFTTLNCVEILERRIYGTTDNWSDRFLAKISGTDVLKGNMPNAVANTLRKRGVCAESLWPFKANTFDAYYAPIFSPLFTKALQFIAEYDFGHEWVSGDQQSMMDALRLSPLGVGVFAWTKDADGFYIRPFGAESIHYCVVYGYERNNYWKVFDTYDNTRKKLRWDFGFDMVKRYTLKRQVIDETAWGRFKALLRSILGL